MDSRALEGDGRFDVLGMGVLVPGLGGDLPVSGSSLLASTPELRADGRFAAFWKAHSRRFEWGAA